MWFYLLITLLAVLIGYWLGIYTGAHYVPTSDPRVKRMLKLAQVGPEDLVTDLGCGDGRFLVEAAKLGARAVGYEINPLLVLIARRNIRRAGIEKNARVYWKNFWNEDLSPYSVVVVFGIPHIMGALEGKLKRELKPGARVVSNAFRFPTWESKEDERVFLSVR